MHHEMLLNNDKPLPSNRVRSQRLLLPALLLTVSVALTGCRTAGFLARSAATTLNPFSNNGIEETIVEDEPAAPPIKAVSDARVDANEPKDLDDHDQTAGEPVSHGDDNHAATSPTSTLLFASRDEAESWTAFTSLVPSIVPRDGPDVLPAEQDDVDREAATPDDNETRPTESPPVVTWNLDLNSELEAARLSGAAHYRAPGNANESSAGVTSDGTREDIKDANADSVNVPGVVVERPSLATEPSGTSGRLTSMSTQQAEPAQELPSITPSQSYEDQPESTSARPATTSRRGFKSIREITVDIRPQSVDESGNKLLLPEDVDSEPLVANEPRTDDEPESPVPNTVASASQLPNRTHWGITNYQWRPSNVCHKPLYFEEPNAERHGYTFGCWQPVTSAVHFYGSVAVLPYKMGVDPPNSHRYALGHYRPGSCAPYRQHHLPLDACGLAIQAAVMTGIAFLP